MVDTSVPAKWPWLGGFIVGASIAWAAIATIHSEQFTVLETSKKELEQQVFDLKTSDKAKGTEISRLREHLNSVPPATTRKDLEAFIQRLDKEIAQKHDEYARHFRIVWSRGDPPEGKPLTEQEKSTRDRFEKELDRLGGQRDEVRRKLIELTAK